MPEIGENMNEDKNKSASHYAPEPGEESLAILMKEAGKTAREQKKRMLEEHFKKIHLAVTGQLGNLQQEKSI